MYLWDFVGFAFKILEAPGLFEAFWDGVQIYALAIIFGLLTMIVYGGLLLYFMFIVGRSLLYLQLSVAFAPLIVASLAFEQTRGTFKAGIRMIVNAGLTMVAAGFAMGITFRILSGTQEMIACFSRETRGNACVQETQSLANAMGVDNAIFADALSSFEVFSLLTILGAFCWMVHWAAVKFISQITETPDDSGPLAAFAGATTGMISMGASKGLSALTEGGKAGLGGATSASKFSGKLGAAAGLGLKDRMQK
ncbi:MAG: hypothetical protein JKY81_00045 [Colwellia sp.]|nr:hypothetical protein [Colwellia sp.]